MGFIAPELPEEFGGQGTGLPGGRRDPRGDRPRRPEHLLHQPAGLAERPDPVAARPARGRRSPGSRSSPRGEALFAIALTEPRGGSDAANLRLRVERVGDDYVLNGEKTSISAADQADATVVFGRTGTVESGAHGVTALLVPMDLPGVTTQPLRLPRPARHRPRLDLLRERARARRATASATRTRASCR